MPQFYNEPTINFSTNCSKLHKICEPGGKGKLKKNWNGCSTKKTYLTAIVAYIVFRCNLVVIVTKREVNFFVNVSMYLLSKYV